MEVLKAVNLGLRFVLELCLLAAYAVWGFAVSGPLVVKILLAVGLVVVVATVWGIFLSPKRSVKLPERERLVMEVALFALAVAALAVTGPVIAAGGLGLAYSINRVLLMAWKQG